MERAKTLTSLCVGCVCLAVATTSRADFVGAVSEILTDPDTADLCGAAEGAYVPFPLTVCNVSIQFDEDDDRLLSLAFADLQVMNGVNPGVFYHHTFGSDTPYICLAGGLNPFPDLMCDSYVAIGLPCADYGTTVDPDFDSDAFNGTGSIIGGWFNNNPFNGQGDAFGIINPDGKVLILQSGVAVGLSLEGSATVLWQNIGDPTVFENVVEIVCQAQCPDDCPADVNGDGETGPLDLATLLSAWGPTFPDNCLDANDDGDIGPLDLASLLAAWGPCP